MAAELLAEVVVKELIKNFIDIGFEFLNNQFKLRTGMREELERLKKNYPEILSVFFAATEVQISDPALNEWLCNLRDVIDEIEDLLDKFEYTKHKERLTRNIRDTEASSYTERIISTLSQIGKIVLDPLLKQLEDVVQKLDSASTGFNNFLQLIKDAKKKQHQQERDFHRTRKTISWPKNKLICRIKEKDYVIAWLRQSLNEEHQTQCNAEYGNISLLSIVGHGGMGKTTILQHVYHDKEIMEEFDLKFWVWVSINSDSNKIIAGMLKRSPQESFDSDTDDLMSAVESKKFLLVLDDIWDDEQQNKINWEDVLIPLARGKFGSKILITTRMDSVAAHIARQIGKEKITLVLEDLKEDESLQCLNSYAFRGVQNLDDHKNLRYLTVEIIKKLPRSPLAAKVCGRALNKRLDETHWNTILNSEFIDTEFYRNDYLPVLGMSYTCLLKPLKKCFLYCCVFPLEHTFEKDDLVKMWIALKFIEQSDSKMAIENIGGTLFDILVSESFFEKLEGKTFYKMHISLNQLAKSIFAGKYFIVDDDDENVRVEEDDELFSRSSEVIYLYVRTSRVEMLQRITRFQNLKSLYLIYKGNDKTFFDVLSKIFKASRKLRLLEIHFQHLERVPKTIRCLIHLRYLRIHSFDITLLPKSLCSLYNLQFFLGLDSYGGSMPDSLFPSNMNHLFNLHYLQLPRKYFSGIQGIGKLTSLQELHEFHVIDKDGYRMKELEHMKNICHLKIKSLNNVNAAEEARNAKLGDKRNLTDLSLEWDDFDSNLPLCPSSFYERVLDNLQPPINLKKLSIIKYMGVKSATWMNNNYLISKLQKICLDSCLEWEILPSFCELLFLKSLYLKNMPKVKRLEMMFYGNDMRCAFLSLEELRLEKLEALENWFDPSSAADDCLFPCLTGLFLKNCPNLPELPYLPPKLKILKIENIR